MQDTEPERLLVKPFSNMQIFMVLHFGIWDLKNYPNKENLELSLSKFSKITNKEILFEESLFLFALKSSIFGRIIVLLEL